MATTVFTIPFQPIALARPKIARHGGVVRMYTSTAQRAHISRVRAVAKQYAPPVVPHGWVIIETVVYLTVPESWPSRKRAAALSGELLPTGRPDIDNYVKLLLDAMTGVMYHDDAQVVAVAAQKQYSKVARWEVTIKHD